jgi:hypothetical protein
MVKKHQFRKIKRNLARRPPGYGRKERKEKGKKCAKSRCGLL